MSRVIDFLRRPGAKPLSVYEAWFIVATELMLWGAVAMVVPADLRQVTLAIGGLSLVGVQLAHARRHYERRDSTAAYRLGMPLRRASLAMDIATWAWALVPALFAGAHAPTWAASLAGLALRVVRDRVAWPAWRSWVDATEAAAYRSRLEQWREAWRDMGTKLVDGIIDGIDAPKITLRAANCCADEIRPGDVVGVDGEGLAHLAGCEASSRLHPTEATLPDDHAREADAWNATIRSGRGPS